MRRQQEAMDHNHLLRRDSRRRWPQSGDGRFSQSDAAMKHIAGGCSLRLLLRAATCCLVLLAISSDFPGVASLAPADAPRLDRTPVDQSASPTTIKDKNVIQSTTTTTTATATTPTAFNGATSRQQQQQHLANKQQQAPNARESNDHTRLRPTGARQERAGMLQREQQFGQLQPGQQRQKLELAAADATARAPATSKSKLPPPPPQLFKYHLNHSRPPPLVPITIAQHLATTTTTLTPQPQPQMSMTTARARGAAAASESKTINRQAAGGAPTNNRASPLADHQKQFVDFMAAAASETDAAQSAPTAGQQQQQLVQLQLPLELHLKLKPLPLPMPPPPSVRQQTQADESLQAKRRRSLSAIDEFGSSRATTTTTTTTTEAPIATSTSTEKPREHRAHGNRHSAPGDLQALTWQEAKRVLLMNSIAPPLVQAAHRRIERRHLLLAPGGSGQDQHQHQGQPTQNQLHHEQVLASNHLFAHDTHQLEQPAQVSVDSSPVSPPFPSSFVTPIRSQQQQQFGTTATPLLAHTSPSVAVGAQATTRTTSEVTTPSLDSSRFAAPTTTVAAQQQSPTQGHHHHHLQERLSSMHGIQLNGGEFLNASVPTRRQQQQQQAQEQDEQRTASESLGEHEARIQAMAAAMLPFVWPSFQLTAGKMRARESAQQQRLQTTTTTTSSPPAWSMKYQQLSRTSAVVPQSAASSSSTTMRPEAASVFRPTFVDLDQEPPAAAAAAASFSTTTTTTTSAPTLTTTTTTTSTTSTRPTSTRRREAAARSAAVLQQQQQPETRSPRKRRRKSGYLQQQQERLERQNLQLQLNKKAKSKEAAVAATAKTTELPPITTTPMPMPKHEGATASSGDSTRLASRYQMPRIKFSANRTTPSMRSGDHEDGLSRTTPRLPALQQQVVAQQLPKSLGKLIEQQLASAASANSTIRQNLLLLQQYFSQKQNLTSALAASKAPTTSVSRVVHRLPASDLLRVTTNHTARPAPEVTTTSAPRETSFEQSRAPLQPPTSPTSTTTTERPESTTLTPAPAAVTTTTTQKPLTGIAPKSQEAPELRSNKILPEEEESQQLVAAPPAQSTPTTTTTSSPTTPTTRPMTPKPTIVPPVNNKQPVEQTTTTSKPAKQQQPQSPWQQQKNRASSAAALAARNNKNIKLFHFKRKPDVAKLPFYKKPLNYTELGWTPEEIEREQRRLAELQALELPAPGGGVSSGESSAADSNDDGEDSNDQEASSSGTTGAPKSGPLTIGQSGDFSLLKRKRRAKNQFERLMAELQAAALANGTTTTTTTTTTTEQPAPADANVAGGRSSGQPTARNDDDDDEEPDAEAEGQDAAQGEREVPTMRKRAESLVMKPMFFVMNQKSRRQGGGSGGNHTAPSELVVESPAINKSLPVRTSGVDEKSEVAPSTLIEVAKSKPIVRLRRKHHGEQTEVVAPLAVGPASSPWRPSGPGWSLSPAVAPRLVLVPSGLLTPSGSHPMPLFAPTSSHLNAPDASAADGPQAWREQQASAPASQPMAHMPPPPQQEAPTQEMSPQQPAPLQVSALMPPAQGGPQPSELRVPKLLVKPMRPAKYSLNGYIPKPSLNGQIQGAGGPPSGPMTSNAGTPTQSSPGKPAQTHSGPARSAKPQSPLTPRHPGQQLQQQQRRQLAGRQLAAGQSSGVLQNKDLDSSTSNEIFSRRRGLQKAAAQARASGGISFEALLARSSRHQESAVAVEPAAAAAAAAVLADLPSDTPDELAAEKLLPPARNQMEENRRKYVRQHQQTFNAFKSAAPMSIQRANQIKAKLGLAAVPNSIRPRPDRSSEEDDSDEDSAALPTGARSKSVPAGVKRNKWLPHGQQRTAGEASTNSIATLEPDAALELAIAGAGQQLTAGSASYHTIPKTDFECTNQRGHFVSGLFADFKTGCRVWHLCSNNRKYSFLCPTGTIFNAKVRICDWRYNVKCENEPPL